MYTLYYRPECPFCKRVLEFIREGDIKMDMRDTNKKENSDALMKRGGKKQVPFLIDDENDISMYESDDIVAYLTVQSTE